MEFDTSVSKIRKYPDPRLRRMSEPIAEFDGSVAELAKQMLAVMHRDNGVGLAAPQVGVSIRMFVCNCTGEPGDDRVYINPVLSDLNGDIESEEGCLSVPDVTVTVRRAETCVIDAVDIHGKPFRETGADLAARCWQHEIDHLDGKLIVDYMSDADKIANRRVLKQMEAQFKRRSTTRR